MQGWAHGEMERDAGVLATERLSPERGHGTQQHIRVCAGGQLPKRVSRLPGREWMHMEHFFVVVVNFKSLNQKTWISETKATTMAKSLCGRDHSVTWSTRGRHQFSKKQSQESKK